MPRPHDLIWLRDPQAFVAEGAAGFPHPQPLSQRERDAEPSLGSPRQLAGAETPRFGLPQRADAGAPLHAWPDWADAAWLTRAPVVVRRDHDDAGRIPVGLRGVTRAQRYGAWLHAEQCARVVTPGEVARQARWRDHPRRDEIPALHALAQISRSLDARAAAGHWHWGLTGAVGFSLAAGIDVLHAGSDIDLLVTAPAPLAQDDEQWLADLALCTHGVRLDIQIATPYGGFALAERLRTGGRVLLKTDRRPILCDDPWRIVEPMSAP